MTLTEIIFEIKQIKKEMFFKKVTNDGYYTLLGQSILLLLILSFIFWDFSIHGISKCRLMYIPVICLIISDLIRFDYTRQLLFSYTYFYRHL